MKEKKQDDVQTQPVLVTSNIAPEEKIVCDVCGYANPEHTAICVMCSNYLERR